MTFLETTISGIPCRVELLSYRPYRDNRRGHIDDWLPDDPVEIEFEVFDRKGYPAPWLAKKMTDKDIRRIEGELELHLLEEAENDV